MLSLNIYEMDNYMTKYFHNPTYACWAKVIDHKKFIKLLESNSYQFADREERCPSTVVFNQLRKILVEKFNYKRSDITPDRKLSWLFPDRNNRGPVFQHFCKTLNVKESQKHIFKMSKTSCTILLIILILASYICLHLCSFFLTLNTTICCAGVLITMLCLAYKIFTAETNSFEIFWEDKTFGELIQLYLLHKIIKENHKEKLTRTEAIIYFRTLLNSSLLEDPLDL